MNEETVFPTEGYDDSEFESFPPEDQETVIETDDWTVAAEMTSETVETVAEETEAEDTTPEETVAMTTEPVLVNVIAGAANEIAHVNLFGSFLICGTLVGLALLRKIYGT